MKILPNIFIPAIAALAAIPTDARTTTDHTPRDGDLLHPGYASPASLISAVDDSTKTVSVNPRAVSFDSGGDAYVYIDGDTVSYVRSATKHRFTLRGDTLSYIGHEDRASDFRLDRPARVALFPLNGGDVVRDGWSGHLLRYGSMALKHVSGESRSLVDKGWTLTEGTDTLHNVTRLVWTLDMAYADPDSVTSSMPDSVASERISEMQVDVKAVLSERLLTERAMWFTEGARYPVLTDSRVSRIMLGEGGTPTDTVPLSLLAMYYPVSWQRSDTGEDITDGNTRGTDCGHTNDAYEDSSPDSGAALSVGEPKVSGDFVKVTLSSRSGTVDATVTLFSDSGIRLTEPVTVTVGTAPQVHSMEAPSGWSGVMLLRVDAGEESYTRKIIR